jgi:hypothetical protein
VFEGLIAAHPANFWLPLAYGNAWVHAIPSGRSKLYRRAADGFRASGHAKASCSPAAR